MKCPASLLMLSLILTTTNAPAAMTDHTKSLAPIVVTATMTEQSLAVAPGTVEVITKEDIDAMGAESVTDVLEQTISLIIMTEAGRAQSISMRGLGSGHTLVLVDGRRLVSGYKASLDANQIPVTLIDHIEIVRGPGSALYGSEATGGVINIITRKTPEAPEGEIDLRGGIGDSAEQSVQGMAGAAVGPLRFSLAAGHFKKDGWDGDGELPDDIDDTVQDTACLKGDLDLGPTQTLSMGGQWNQFSRDGNRLLQNMERRREAEDQRWGGFLKYDLHPSDAFNGMFQIYGNKNQNDIEITPEMDDAERDRNLLQVEGRGSYSLADGLTITGGGEIRWEELPGDELVGTTANDVSDRIKAVFGQFDWFPLDWLNIVGSLRFDDYNNSGSHLSPRLTASVFLPQGRFWLSYGHGFKAPTLDEMYGEVKKSQGKQIYIGNPDLDPETSRGYEAGIELHGQKIWGRVVGFYNHLDDIIDARLIETQGKIKTYEYQNVDEAWTAGAEIEAGITLMENLSLNGQSSWLTTENEETGEALAYEPSWKGKLMLVWHVPAFKLETRLTYLYVGKSEDGEGNELDDYDRTNFYLSTALTKNLRLYAGIDNLFDEQCDDFTQSPFQVYAGVNLHF